MSKSIIYLGKSVLLTLALLFISSIIINTSYYYDLISNNLIRFIKMFLLIISYFIGGLYIGRNSDSKGYINGLKLSLIMVIISLLLSVILGNIKVTMIIYYFIITICITFGSMIGINNNKK